MAEYIEREAALRVLCDACGNAACPKGLISRCSYYEKMQSIPAADVRPVPKGGIGEMSDGYHTFNGLYYQRMVLFAALVKAHKNKAWKSWKHEDGELCFGGGWFIVGIDTPEGSYTYHYDKMYWNLFECEELPTAKHWDGHTEKDVTRLLSLDVRPVVRAHWTNHRTLFTDGDWYCSSCGEAITIYMGPDREDRYAYCPHCGADMRGEIVEDTTSGCGKCDWCRLDDMGVCRYGEEYET